MILYLLVLLEDSAPPPLNSSKTIAINVAPARNNFIPLSSIRNSATKTLIASIVEEYKEGEVDGEDVVPLVVGVIKENNVEAALKAQREFSKNSGLFGYNVMHFGKDREGIDESMTEKHVYGRVLSIPNKKKNIESYAIQYVQPNGSRLCCYRFIYNNLTQYKGGKRLAKGGICKS